MQNIKHVVPYLNGSSSVSYTCPSCGTLAQQQVSRLSGSHIDYGIVNFKERENQNLYLSTCSSCNCDLIWLVHSHSYSNGALIIYPNVNALPVCHVDAPSRVSIVYAEASQCYSISLRASAALIRVATEQLLREVFQSEKMLGQLIESNKDKLGNCYAMANALRLTGNDGSHATAEILDLEDDSNELVAGMFELFNALVEKLIAEPNRTHAFLQKINDKKSIKGFDSRSSKSSD